jgi:hypothetical protein
LARRRQGIGGLDQLPATTPNRFGIEAGDLGQFPIRASFWLQGQHPDKPPSLWLIEMAQDAIDVVMQPGRFRVDARLTEWT